jgi:hypothetical protein
MKHTFLLKTGTWEATGEFTDGHAHRFSFQGQSKISHQRDHWTLNGAMKLLIDPPVEFFHTYRIVPLAKNKEWTPWESHNPAIGDLCGRFAFVGDTILSSWTSKDLRFNGVEALLYVNDTTYTTRGVLFQEGEKLSSWEGVLMHDESQS